MSNPKARTLPDVFSMFFIMCAVYGIDLFLFKTDLTILGTSLFAWIMGFALLVMYIRGARTSRKLLGISFRNEKILAGVLYGAVFSVVPIVAVILAEFIYFSSLSPITLDISFVSPNLIYSDDVSLATVAIVYAVSILAASAFKEFFFRGFMLRTLRKNMSFAKANLLQSAMYLSFTVVLILRNFLYNIYDENAKRRVLLIVAFCAVNEMLSGIKRGMMTRVSGATYIALVDSYIYTFFSTCLMITESYTAWMFMPHMLAIQVLSFLLTLVYYKISMKKINIKKAHREAREQTELREIEARRKANEEKSINKKTDGIDEISPDNFKKIVRNDSHSKRRHLSDEEILQGKKSIEETLTTPIEDTSTDEVNAILKDFTRERSSHHKHRSREITADFNADNFLETYGKDDGKKHHHHHRSESKHHKSGSATKPKQVQAEKKISKKPKLTFTQKLQSLGGIDDSASNDLI